MKFNHCSSFRFGSSINPACPTVTDTLRKTLDHNKALCAEEKTSHWPILYQLRDARSDKGSKVVDPTK